MEGTFTLPSVARQGDAIECASTAPAVTDALHARRNHPREEQTRQAGRRSALAPANPIAAILAGGLVAGATVPWAVIWLSDTLSFDIPDGTQWLIFAAPAALTTLAGLIRWSLRGRRPAK
jgi:hypothetical protein